MIWGILTAVAASLAYGTSSVMQAYGARTSKSAALARGEGGLETVSGAPSLRSTVLAILTVPFIVGTVLDVGGFAGNAISARLAPLFLSQTIISANLIVTAVLGIFFLQIHLKTRDWIAITTVIVALCALGIASKGEGTDRGSDAFHWGLLIAAVLLFAVSIIAMQWLGSKAAVFCGLAAGVLFGAVAIAVRVMHGIDPFDLGELLADPATYALVIAGCGGFYMHTVALQLGSVNGATAALVAGETVVPGIIGVVALGDKAVPGLEWLAVVGFVLAVVGAVAVAVFGAAEPDSPDAAEPATEAAR